MLIYYIRKSINSVILFYLLEAWNITRYDIFKYLTRRNFLFHFYCKINHLHLGHIMNMWSRRDIGIQCEYGFFQYMFTYFILRKPKRTNSLSKHRCRYITLTVYLRTFIPTQHFFGLITISFQIFISIHKI